MINADRHHVSAVLYTSDSITSNRPSDRARVNGSKRSGNTIGWLCHHSLCSDPMTAPIVLIIIFYQNKVPSLVRYGLQNISNSRTFRLLDPTSVSRGQLKQKDILFSRETNRHAIICCTYKTGHYCEYQVSSLSPLPIRFLLYCFLLLLTPWPTPLSPILLLPALRRSTTMTLGTTLRRRVPRW
jgi:hypothetical protein